MLKESAAAITLIAHGPPSALSPEILLDGAINQVWVKITSLLSEKRFLENNTQINIEGKKGNDGNEKVSLTAPR